MDEHSPKQCLSQYDPIPYMDLHLLQLFFYILYKRQKKIHEAMMHTKTIGSS